ncbi:expressed unknown protein [Seminavis robusta]|uniref:Uncharacterized protein n=1 Tax=Seminavis robusta TaxID=568900 RepID=A0A9N8E1I0_9STRA|nr:expressed unknown protein [Seminavis robusta]|eukprot:Sro412_g137880.1 n/a (308) ;mRNA; r:36986-38225
MISQKTNPSLTAKKVEDPPTKELDETNDELQKENENEVTPTVYPLRTLLGFIGTQVMIVSIIGTTDAVAAATCACLRDTEQDAFCHETGNATFSLPADGSLRVDEWNPYVITSWAGNNKIQDAFADCPVDATLRECSRTKFCCYAYVGSLLGEEDKDKWHTMSPFDPCPDYAQWLDTIALSVYGVLLSYLILNPLVKYMLARESRRCNPCAYCLIFLQTLWGVTSLVVYSETSQDLGISQTAYTSVLTNVALGIFVTSIAIGMVLETMVYPLLVACCTCKKSGGEENGQPDTEPEREDLDNSIEHFY